MRKKINVGLITISKSPINFGANLQSFALWRYLNSLDCVDCKIIDLKRPCHSFYRNSKQIKFNSEYLDSKFEKDKLSFVKKVKKIIKFFLPRRVPKKFKEFQKLMSYTRTLNIDDLYTSNLKFDIFVTGSDQVWNCFQPYYVEPYFLTFTDKVKISYASSFGVSNIPDEYKAVVYRWLESYKAISVREKSGQEILADLNKDVKLCIDPTFLLTKNEWSSFLDKKRIINEKYNFIYSLHYFADFVQISNEMKFNNVKSVSFCDNINKNNVIPSNIGPWEFLSLIRDADLIITDSFHCVVFSILFQKKFWVIKDKTNSKTFDRIDSLLYATNLNDRIYSKEKNIYDEISYTDSDLLLKMINDSKKFLYGGIYEN